MKHLFRIRTVGAEPAKKFGNGSKPKMPGSRYATLDKKNAGQGYFIPSKYVDSIIGKPVGF